MATNGTTDKTTARDLLTALEAIQDQNKVLIDQNRRMLEGLPRIERAARGAGWYAGWICALILLWMIGALILAGQTQRVRIETDRYSFGR